MMLPTLVVLYKLNFGAYCYIQTCQTYSDTKRIKQKQQNQNQNIQTKCVGILLNISSIIFMTYNKYSF